MAALLGGVGAGGAGALRDDVRGVLVTEPDEVVRARALAALQAVRPPGQRTVQAPAPQTCPAGQTVPHAPQWFGSDWRSRQVPLQSVVPAPQETTHAPRSQICPMGHTLPQAPQLFRSVRGSAQ